MQPSIEKLYQEALALYDKGDVRSAVYALRRAHYDQPDHIDITSDLISLLFNLGFLEEARSAFLRVPENFYHDQRFQEFKKIFDELPEPSVEKLPSFFLGIPTRNRLNPLLLLLESVKEQTVTPKEIIVSDDGDNPEIEMAVKNLFSNLNIRWIQGPKRNLPSNRQNILNHSDTELLIMCDDDHVLDTYCFENLIKAATVDPRIGIVCSVWPEVSQGINEVDINEHPGDLAFKRTLTGIGKDSHFWWKDGTELFKVIHKNPTVFDSELAGGGCLLYRTSAVKAVGGFPQDYSVVSFREDTDMSHRVYLSGMRVTVQPLAIACHNPAKTGGCRDSREWVKNFISDGLTFLNKLEIWRLQFDEGKQISSSDSRIIYPTDSEIQSIVQTEMSSFLVPNSLRMAIDRVDGKFSYLIKDIYPQNVDNLINPEAVQRLVNMILDIPPFYIHQGGVGDALLLLSRIYDEVDQITILSFPNSHESLQAFFSEFPKVRQVYFAPETSNPLILHLIRLITYELENILGRGVLPKGTHAEEWIKGINIFEYYQIKQNPDWVKSFSSTNGEYQNKIVIHPFGSGFDMVGEKVNSFSLNDLNELIEMLNGRNEIPIILGSPKDQLIQLKGQFHDLRGQSYRSQMEAMTSARLMIGADSWAKTFSALIGKKSFVMSPIRTLEKNLLNRTNLGDVDPSANVFLLPWPSIDIIFSIEELVEKVGREFGR